MRIKPVDNRIKQVKPKLVLEGQSPASGGHRKAENDLFMNALKQAQEKADVRFSKHAVQRLTALTQADDEDYLDGLKNAMNLAQAKGARSTLVLMKGAAFLVAPQSRTVVTVIPEDRMKHNVFTSIDSAVLVDKYS